MEEVRHSVLWQEEEITVLLQTIRDRGYSGLLMDSTRLPNRAAYRAIARALEAAGYRRTPKQVCTKWKSLKGDFYRVVQAWGKVPRHSCWPENYSELRQIWRNAGRPRLADRRPRGRAGPETEEEEQREEGRDGDSSQSDGGDARPGTSQTADVGTSQPAASTPAHARYGTILAMLTSIDQRLRRVEARLDHLEQPHPPEAEERTDDAAAAAAGYRTSSDSSPHGLIIDEPSAVVELSSEVATM
uniref:Uncharacterized protein n=1 Tax=Sphaerodactylus townsendi TaxID=933632 RepID=A0ACB8F7U2_9SAUR